MPIKALESLADYGAGITPHRWELGALVRSIHSETLSNVEQVVGATQKIIEKARDHAKPPVPVRMPEIHYGPTQHLLDEIDLVGGGGHHGGHHGGWHGPMFPAGYGVPMAYPVYPPAYDLVLLDEDITVVGEVVQDAEYARLDSPSTYFEYRDALEDTISVPLSLPPDMNGAWDCWHDRKSGTVAASIALPGHDGEVKIATSATPVAPLAAKAARYAREAGVDVDTVMGVLPTIACMLGGSALLPQMAMGAVPMLVLHATKARRLPLAVRAVPSNRARRDVSRGGYKSLASMARTWR